MTDSVSPASDSSAKPSAAVATRVDAAHTVGPDEDRPLPTLESENEGQTVPVSAETLRSQAGQLAGHLRHKQKELDRREGQMHAHSATMESNLRASRLWITEKEEELAERQRAIEKQIADFEQEKQQRQTEQQQQAMALAAAQEADQREADKARKEIESVQQELESHKQELDSRGDLLDNRQKELDQRERQLETAKQEVLNQIQQLEEQDKQREARLAETEDVLLKQLRQVESDLQQIDDQREALNQQARDDRKMLAQRQNHCEAEWDRRKKEHHLQRQQLDKRTQAVEQLQADVSIMHREALEMRLIAEQLWAELAANTSPAELTQALSRARCKLADHYRLAGDMLTQRKEEMGRLAGKLDNRCKEIDQKRDELQQWVDHRQQEIEEQAARLVAREQELDGQQRRSEDLSQQWSQQRREYENRIRQLTMELRSAEKIGASQDSALVGHQ